MNKTFQVKKKLKTAHVLWGGRRAKGKQGREESSLFRFCLFAYFGRAHNVLQLLQLCFQSGIAMVSVLSSHVNRCRLVGKRNGEDFLGRRPICDVRVLSEFKALCEY